MWILLGTTEIHVDIICVALGNHVLNIFCASKHEAQKYRIFSLM